MSAPCSVREIELCGTSSISAMSVCVSCLALRSSSSAIRWSSSRTLSWLSATAAGSIFACSSLKLRGIPLPPIFQFSQVPVVDGIRERYILFNAHSMPYTTLCRQRHNARCRLAASMGLAPGGWSLRPAWKARCPVLPGAEFFVEDAGQSELHADFQTDQREQEDASKNVRRRGAREKSFQRPLQNLERGG